MAVETVITITHDKEVIADVNNAIPGQGLVMQSFRPEKEAEEIRRYLEQLAMGARMGSVIVAVNTTAGVYASGTVTCATALANDTVTIAAVVLTAVSGTPSTDQFDISGTDTADALSLVAAINANATLATYVFASSALGVVTIRARTKGPIGNLISLATSNNTRLAKSGTVLASGAGNNASTTTTYAFGV